MEFKLNKIGIEIRKQMEEERKSDKVHQNEKVVIKNEKKEESAQLEYDSNKHQQKRYYTIDAVKTQTVEICAEKIQITTEENKKGNLLDKRK